jgi:Uma2 family endonuclease
MVSVPMEATLSRITAEQFSALEFEDDRRRELVDGRIVVNEPMPFHALIQARLTGELHVWVGEQEGRGLVFAPTNVVMDAHNVYGPDILWIAERHLPADLTKRLARVPDLCVEVRSPSTWRYDVGTKLQVYEAGGLPELWLVDIPAESILVYRRSRPRADHFDVALEIGRGEALTSPQLPGFELRLDELFRR